MSYHKDIRRQIARTERTLKSLQDRLKMLYDLEIESKQKNKEYWKSYRESLKGEKE